MSSGHGVLLNSKCHNGRLGVEVNMIGLLLFYRNVSQQLFYLRNRSALLRDLLSNNALFGGQL